MDLATVGLLALGLAMLVGGGELLVQGASRLARVFGMSPLVVGLTVVAFGTSSPELAVSLRAGLAGTPDLAVGNVVGSNVFNVLFILGLCALLAPLVVSRVVVRREVPIMVGASVLLFLLARDGSIGAWDGLLFLFGIVVYVAWSVLAGRREAVEAGTVMAGARGEMRWGTLAWEAGRVGLGLGVLVVGADFLIAAATAMARGLGVSDLIIGLTIVAGGTSLPEVATSLIATFRGERDIAIGNVLGSNIFNILGILGVSALVTPGGLTVAPTVVSFDLPVMVAVAVACLPIFFTGLSIARWEGALFLATYGAYLVFLVLAAIDSPALESFTNAVLLMLPVVAATLLWGVVQSLRADRSKEGTGP